ncbi:MAG: toxin-antitoxin system YwqK family antitoxin [Bacteroidia bacterium]
MKLQFRWIFLIFVLSYGYAQPQSFELDPSNGKDSINIIDFQGLKQGRWITFGKSKPNSCYQLTSKVEEGKYNDNKKNGIWKEYFCNGNTKNKITFQNGRPDGYAIMYHENGKISEEGIWKVNKWVGNYKLYYDNGNVQQEFTFNPGGKREGPQKYYYEDGTTQIEGNWNGGKESGVVTEYYQNGDTKKTINYNNGDADVASIKTFEPKKPIKEVPPDKVDNTKVVKADPKNETTQDPKVKLPTVLNGPNVLYNKNRQKTKDGIFKDNRFMDGKSYRYNDDGILIRIEIYKNGAYIGDAQIDE